MSGGLRFSVIVPVWNSPALIEKCLNALERQTFPRERFEIIVVDNGSTDETADVVRRYPDVTLLSETKPGSYNARNTGLEIASGEYVAFTDADCVPDPGWLAAADAAIEAHPGAAVYGGRMVLFASDADSPVCRAYEEIFSFDQEKYIAAGHCVTANWVSPLSLIRELGGFDARLKSGGDFALSTRISKRGLRMIYVPGMEVGHPYRGSPSEIIGKRRRTIGGVWTMRDSLLGRVKLVVWVFRSMIGNLGRVWSSAGRSADLKLAVSMLVMRGSAAQLAEIGRIMMGGEPRRS